MEISKTKLEVMQAIWQGTPFDAETIIQRLNKQKEWHEKTVKTLLNRLVKKQALDFKKVAFHHFPSTLDNALRFRKPMYLHYAQPLNLFLHFHTYVTLMTVK